MKERGEGRFGCLLSGAVLAAAIFVTYKMVPVYLDKIGFEEDLDRLSRRAAVEFIDDGAIEEQILRAARSYGFELTLDDIGIRRSSRHTSNPKIFVTVHYVRRLPFPAYTHIFDFTSTVESMVGSF